MVGALVLVSGLIHLGILVISGGTWEGPLSLRKATTFGLSFGLTLITIVWVAALLRLSDRSLAALLGPSGGDDRQVCCWCSQEIRRQRTRPEDPSSRRTR
ncbi:MAG: hypothetical protein AUI47_02445 [Acidobacteria bacterium 13_1_40CM_2_68_5]|nr:MAG: hypothetical protein AUI47_02445 [Acidobacteria bacterium 13_1_40CM_2_68_5]